MPRHSTRIELARDLRVGQSIELPDADVRIVAVRESPGMSAYEVLTVLNDRRSVREFQPTDAVRVIEDSVDAMLGNLADALDPFEDQDEDIALAAISVLEERLAGDATLTLNEALRFLGAVWPATGDEGDVYASNLTMHVDPVARRLTFQYISSTAPYRVVILAA